MLFWMRLVAFALHRQVQRTMQNNRMYGHMLDYAAVYLELNNQYISPWALWRHCEVGNDGSDDELYLQPSHEHPVM